MIYAIHPPTHPSIHPSTPLRRWSCRLFHLLGRGAPLLSPATPKPFTISIHFWQEIGRNLQSFHLRENKKSVQISILISKKGKQEFRCPKSPPHCLIASQECKIHLQYNTSPNKLDGIDFCYNFCSLKRYQLRLKTMASTVETQP